MNNVRKFLDSSVKKFLLTTGILNIVIIFVMFLFIFINGIQFFKHSSVSDFLFGTKWISLSGIYGLIPLLVGSFWVTIVAILISVPLGILTAVYIFEYAPGKIKNNMKILIEIMSAIPSVVLGFIGLYVLSGPIKNLFNLNSGLTSFTGSIMLAFMALPTIVTMTEDALNALDPSYKEASLALGATKIETIFNILLPAAFPGIFAGIMLGFGRIIGETLTVLMVTGNAPIIAKSPLSSVRTMTATIAAEMGEVVQGSDHYFALFAIGIILFLISFITNTIADHFVTKARKLKN
ncbi:phosphate ABC transporter permease subunit PstC [Fusobacterium perfoetens]|uniref:phosphate ABC transporter permease subunit PstC n=1 Tax=Fusobacterium perfoetens TaxID=852 RepID=UPI000480C998|nr:phosphate ABC transporter permease subunit PstC [Fusobacterium perfoetens]MCI6152165.1 phosphate ABC transporter permease subunit PstC [Fusobacterium perfoetens]MDY3237944.1 phosphate ABC transporter permease subunit PstC [Fusobacterium perfoetens]